VDSRLVGRHTGRVRANRRGKHRQPQSHPRAEVTMGISLFAALSIASVGALALGLRPDGTDPSMPAARQPAVQPEPLPVASPAAVPTPPSLPTHTLEIPATGPSLKPPTIADVAPPRIDQPNSPEPGPRSPAPDARVIEQDHGSIPQLPDVQVVPSPPPDAVPPQPEQFGLQQQPCFLLCGVTI
jgi:hypothetical protein